MKNQKNIIKNEKGRAGVPILLWIFGMPASAAILIWALFFRGP